MIGQNNIINYFKNAINKNKLNGFYIINAPKKHGKTTLIEQVAKAANMPLVLLDKPKIDDVRNLIERCQALSVPTVFAINNADFININSQNAMLKLLEEPSEKAFIFLEVTDMLNILPTIKSRAVVVDMEPYNRQDLYPFTDDEILLDLCSSPGAVEEFKNIDYKGLIKFVNTIKDNIGKITIMNVFNIPNYVAFKEGDEGYPLDLVMMTMQQAFKDSYSKAKIISKHRRQMNHVSINKKNSFEMMLVNMWEDERLC